MNKSDTDSFFFMMYVTAIFFYIAPTPKKKNEVPHDCSQLILTHFCSPTVPWRTYTCIANSTYSGVTPDSSSGCASLALMMNSGNPIAYIQPLWRKKRQMPLEHHEVPSSHVPMLFTTTASGKCFLGYTYLLCDGIQGRYLLYGWTDVLHSARTVSYTCRCWGC